MLVPVHRLFFALRPPAAKVPMIAAKRDSLGAGSMIVRDDRLHATLTITNDYPDFPDALAARMIDIGDSIVAGPVPVALDQAVGTQHSVALRPRKGLTAMRDLQAQLDRPLERRGLRRLGWSFSPHVTLFYWNGKPFQQPIETIAWESLEFVLIHSIVGRTQHIILARWSLETRQYPLPLH